MNTATIFLLMASVLAPPVKTSAERSTRIYVRTIPPGASVVLDGKELGTTDGLFLVPPGVRTITLEMDGYDPKAERVDVREGWITRVEVRLGKKRKDAAAAALSPERADTSALEPFAEWALLPIDSNRVDGRPLNTNEVTAALRHREDESVEKLVLYGRLGITPEAYRRALTTGYELVHRHNLFALITPGIEEGTEKRAFPPLEMRYSAWRIKDDGTMEFGERPATIETIRENLGSRNAEESQKLVLLLECPAGSLYEKWEEAIDQAFEWQREFGLAGIGLGITSETRAGRLEDRRVVILTVRGDGTQMEVTTRVEKNYNAYTRQTWTATLDEIPAILRSLPNRERKVLEVRFTEEVPQETCQDLMKLAASWADQLGFWYCCNSGGPAVLPTGKMAKTPCSVRWVVQDEDDMTFEGDSVTLEQLPQLLRMVPNRSATVLELGYDPHISVQMRNEYVGRATIFAHQFGFKYASDIGEQKLGSQGSPARTDVSRAGWKDQTNTPGIWTAGAVVQLVFDAKGIPTVDGKPATLQDVRAQLTQLEHPEATQVVLAFPAATPFAKCQEILEQVTNWRNELRLAAVSLAVVAPAPIHTGTPAKVDEGQEQRQAVDLDTGKFYYTPTEYENWEDAGWQEWIEQRGIDLATCLDGNQWFLFLTSPTLTLVPANDVKWQDAEVRVGGVLAAAAERLATLTIGDGVGGRVLVLPENTQLPVQFAFRTTAGAEGFLQIVELRKDESRPMRLRWKLTKPAPEKPDPVQPCFGPVHEVTFYDKDAYENRLIDFDTGEMFSMREARVAEDNSLNEWMRENGIDADTDGDGKLIAVDGAFFIEAVESAWERSFLDPTDTEKIRHELLSACRTSSVSAKANAPFPRTYYFETNEGTMGVLQVTERLVGPVVIEGTEPKVSMRVRFRTVDHNGHPRRDKALAMIKQIETALEVYRLDMGDYPSEAQGLGALGICPTDLADKAKWNGPYFKAEYESYWMEGPCPICDPWGNPFRYRYEKGMDRPALQSAGPDLVFDNEDDVKSDASEKQVAPEVKTQPETPLPMRSILLPDADTKDAAVVLDLASGEMLKLPWKTEQEGDARDFTRLGKGDLGFDSELFCLRGGEVALVEDDGSTEPLRVTGQKDDAKIYRLPNIPCQLIVTTAEKRQFVVKVLEKTAKGGLKLEYREKKEGEQERAADKAKPPVESTAPVGFESEQRLRIYDDGSKAPCMVDLDTGRLCPRPAREEAKDMSAEQWMASKGIDAGCETNPAGPGLWGMDMIVLPVASDAWENPRAAAIESELRGGKAGSPAIMSALGGLPRTFWFATREGGKGILQITSQFKDDEGEGFEFRYRLISRPKVPAEVKAQLKVIETAVELYRLDAGSYPRRLEELLTPPKEAKDAKGWSGPYLKSPDGSVPVDPWGNPYQVFWRGKEKERFLGIGSLGPDGKFGTEDDVLSFEPEKGQTPTPAPDSGKQASQEAAENGPGSVLELRICANEGEAKAFEKSGGEDLGWYALAAEDTNPLVTREVDGHAEILLWETPDKSLVAAGPEEKPWRVIKVSVIAEPDKPGRIGVVFDVEGGRRMRELTAANIDRRLAVLVDGRVVAYPIVRSPMGERVEITGNFSKADLNRIATAVQAGMEEKE